MSANTTESAPLEILLYPDPVLKKRARPVTPEELRAGRAAEWDLRELVERMKVTMQEADGLGLAAPQVGVSLRLFTIGATDGAADGLVVFNPELGEEQGVEEKEEGCLSVPGVRGQVKRALAVRLRGLTLDGQPLDLAAHGLLARAMQHETDHLDGVLFIQRIGPAARFLLRRKLRELEDDYAFRHRRHAHSVS